LLKVKGQDIYIGLPPLIRQNVKKSTYSFTWHLITELSEVTTGKYQSFISFALNNYQTG